KQLPNEIIRRTCVMPTLHFNQWRIIAGTETAYYVGRSFQSNIIFYDRFNRKDYLLIEIIMSIQDGNNFKVFSFFSSIYCYKFSWRSNMIRTSRHSLSSRPSTTMN